MQLNINNLLATNNNHGLKQNDINAQEGKLKKYLEKIDNRNQGFYSFIDEKNFVEEIEVYSKEIKNKFKDIVVLGIGGSALGTIALQQSLTHLFENELINRKNPKLHILDNISPELIQQIEDIIDFKKTLFIVISKSGNTPEILALYFYFREQINKRKLSPQKHFVFITDAKQGNLREISNKENIKAFAVPENVGGRFSVLTTVGLLPAKLIGIDIKKLIKGAKVMRDKFISLDAKENASFQLAAIQYLLSKKGKNIQVMFPYSQHLIRFADWYRQLLAESIGKAKNNKGENVHTGLTPVNALGATDQHSQLQLYNEGPNDKFFMFISVKNFKTNIKIPDNKEVEFLKGVSFNKLFQTEMKATAESLTINNRPNISIEVEEINEITLGQLFMFFEGSIAFLGEFYDINAFDQPGVELSKQLTKEYLQKD